MRPAAGPLVQVTGQIAERGVKGSHVFNSWLECGRNDGQSPALAATVNSQTAAVGLRQRNKEVHGTQAAEVDTLVIILVAVVEVEKIIIPQGPEGQVVIDVVGHGHGYAVDADLQCYDSLFGQCRIAAVGTNAGTGDF